MRLFLASALLLATPATATEIVRLSPTEREAVLAAAGNGPERSAVLTPETVRRPSILDRSLYPEFYGAGSDPVRDRKVHGEVSVFAGTGGSYGFAGSAIMPLGESGTAAISVMQGRSPWGGMQGFGFGFGTGDGQRNLGGFGNNLGVLPQRRR